MGQRAVAKSVDPRAVERLDGGEGDGVLVTKGGGDLVYGGTGNDWMNAGAGDDYLNAGRGAIIAFRYGNRSAESRWSGA